jgi:hypothetical protein
MTYSELDVSSLNSGDRASKHLKSFSMVPGSHQRDGFAQLSEVDAVSISHCQHSTSLSSPDSSDSSDPGPPRKTSLYI